MYVQMLNDSGAVTEMAEASERLSECDTEADGHQDYLRLCVVWTSASLIDYAMCAECEPEETYVRVVRS
jgi:hypothetical protein